MSKRKGVSAEEKRQRMLQLFYEKKDFFQLKDLEKLAPKEKGIIAQSVKEVVQNLVDDGLVDSEKIGTSIYFWAFPSKAKHSLKRKVEDLDMKLDHVNGALKKTCEALQNAKKGKDECPEREEVLKMSAQLEEDKVRILNEIKVYKDSDPEAFEQMKKELQLTKEDINKHTDNIFTFISWCKNKFGYDEGFLYKQFNIPSELDYIE